MRISVFDMLKIGVGPSSSHTLGPWKAAMHWLEELDANKQMDNIKKVQVQLYGSLALTGRGHHTDTAILLGLSGEHYETIDTALINQKISAIKESQTIYLGGKKPLNCQANFIEFFKEKSLPTHANGMRFIAENDNEICDESTFYSVGGGFIVKEGEKENALSSVELPYPTDTAADIIRHCNENQFRIIDMVKQNELAWRSEAQVLQDMEKIWQTMVEAVYHGCHTNGVLPGGLEVKRRAAEISHNLLQSDENLTQEEWLADIKNRIFNFEQVLKWVSCFALAVNEENASLSRIVTAPTNGAAGVIPAVLMYYRYLSGKSESDLDALHFLMIAGEIGCLFKKGATISAAMGGCQAEIGVSSAMAAGALTEMLGGSVEQALMAAEIAMEHHLGLTCDPIAGLVQVPCIERNSMGAIKAITAANIALESDPKLAKVSLDKVIQTMWETAKDMHLKYKETSQGGLAKNISVNLSEC